MLMRSFFSQNMTKQYGKFHGESFCQVQLAREGKAVLVIDKERGTISLLSKSRRSDIFTITTEHYHASSRVVIAIGLTIFK